tara:strand:+ start:21 stop:437 length:417 start_codon:yes stop_codon:yes gene_type:complete
MKSAKKNLLNGNIIFFDGICNYCNGFVRFLIKNDPNEILKFSSIQSSFAKSVFKEKGLKSDLTTIVFLKNGEVLIKSNAIIEILFTINFKLLGFLIKIVPVFMRDYVYDFVAKKRYSIFGKTEECVLPEKEINHLFIE